MRSWTLLLTLWSISLSCQCGIPLSALPPATGKACGHALPLKACSHLVLRTRSLSSCSANKKLVFIPPPVEAGESSCYVLRSVWCERDTPSISCTPILSSVLQTTMLPTFFLLQVCTETVRFCGLCVRLSCLRRRDSPPSSQAVSQLIREPSSANLYCFPSIVTVPFTAFPSDPK